MKEYIIRKIITKGNFKYYNKEGVEIRDDNYIKYLIKGIYIAPAYNNVKIN